MYDCAFHILRDTFFLPFCSRKIRASRARYTYAKRFCLARANIGRHNGRILAYYSPDQFRAKRGGHKAPFADGLLSFRVPAQLSFRQYKRHEDEIRSHPHCAEAKYDGRLGHTAGMTLEYLGGVGRDISGSANAEPQISSDHRYR